MKNINNNGTLNGILKADPVFVNNKDGSKKALITLICNEQVVTPDGQIINVTRNIPMQGFIPKTYKGLGPYGFIKSGEYIETEYCIKSNPYNDQLNIIIQIDNIKFGKNLSYRKTENKEPVVNEAAPMATIKEEPKKEINTENIEILDFGDDEDLSMFQ